MRIITVVGARPQFIKAAVVSRAIADYNDREGVNRLEEIIVHTGQHYDIEMSDIFFSEMQIPAPRYSLKVKAATHAAMTGRMMEKIEAVLLKELPDVVLVYGDTNSTLAGALAAVKLGIPVAHVEAGLRSYNMNMPEEINRILTDRVSRWLFCPTATAVDNLRQEGVFADKGEHRDKVWVNNTGDVMYDAALYYQKIARPSADTVALTKNLGRFYLATVHRAENTNDINHLKDIVRAFEEIAKETPVIFPVHPRTAKVLEDKGIRLANITHINPVGYFDMLTLLSKCAGVFTDSGGLQKEAYFFNKPCITLRDETEWVELVDHGYAYLAGANYKKIIDAEPQLAHFTAKRVSPLYGDGNAGGRIVITLADFC